MSVRKISAKGIGEVRCDQLKGDIWCAMMAVRQPEDLLPGCFFFDGATLYFDKRDNQFKKYVRFEIRQFASVEKYAKHSKIRIAR